MLRVARLSLQRPRLSLLAWAVVAVALALIGLGVNDATSPSKTVIPGTDASRAEHLADAEFGPGVLVGILLEGPQGDLDRQGPAIVRALRARGDTRTISAWDAGPNGARMRPRRGAAMIMASVARSEEYMYSKGQDQIDATVDRITAGPVRAYINSTTTLDQGMTDASVDTARTATFLTIPVLFAALLLILRAPLAAFALTVFAGVTALAGFGAIAFAAAVVDIAALTIPLGAMAALTFGVGFGLPMYRRWREELAPGADPAERRTPALAAAAAVATSGRAVLIGGTAVIVAMVVASQVGPSEILISEGIGVVLCAMMAVGGAVVVVPPVLALMGARMEWMRFPAPAPVDRAWNRVSGGGGVVRAALPLGAIATVVLALIAVPALNLEAGSLSPQRLPEGNTARIAYEEMQRVMGPGMATPYNVVMVSEKRPITETPLLNRIDRLQAKIAHDDRVESVVGPAAIVSASRQLEVLPKKLRESTKLMKGAKTDLGRFVGGLGRAASGTRKLQAGLSSAAAGAGELATGGGQLSGGAAQASAGGTQLRAGLDTARDGSDQIATGLDTALAAARKIRDGAGEVLAGSEQLSGGLGTAVSKVEPGVPVVQQMASNVAAGKDAIANARSATQSLAAQLDQAAAALAELPARDPEAASAVSAVKAARDAAGSLDATLGAAQPGLEGGAAVAGAFASQLVEMSNGLKQLYAGSSRLTGGIARLRSANAGLAAGISKLAAGGGELDAGIGKLRDGAAQLENGLGRLAAGSAEMANGSGALATGLGGAVGPVGTLEHGIGKLRSGAARFRANLPSVKDLEKLQKESPGLFDSGYFVLAAVAGAAGSEPEQASFVVNLDRGGNAGQILVIPKRPADEPVTESLGEDMRVWVDEFARSTDTQVALGGLGGQFNDFETAGVERIWPVIAAVAIATALMLMLLLRAIPLTLVAVACDLLAAAASFGIIQLLYGGDDPLLGGPGQLSPISIIGIFAAVFGAAMIFETLLMARAREHFVRDGDAHGAIRQGLGESAPAATGAAVAMATALIPFVATSFITVAQFAVGLAAAIALSALIVRPVLLPAAVELLGRAAWWPASRHAPAPTEPPGGPARASSATPRLA